MFCYNISFHIYFRKLRTVIKEVDEFQRAVKSISNEELWPAQLRLVDYGLPKGKNFILFKPDDF